MPFIHKINNDGKEVKLVTWFIFSWTISIILGLFVTYGYFMSMSMARAQAVEGELKIHNETQQVDMTQIKIQLSQIQADLSWLKQNLNK